MNAMERLKAAMDNAGSCACIGIDPVIDKIPARLHSGPGGDLEHLRTFCFGAVDAVAGIVGVVKPQSACFERYGSKGYALLEEVIDRSKSAGLIVILDAKRGDIGSSAMHYAAGAKLMGADFITCSPYMGRSSIEPFLDSGLGVFALCRTSNPDADELQTLAINDGSTLAHHTGRMISELGDQVGAVVGATNNTDETSTLRNAMPSAMFLVPGVGAQGGTVEDVKAMCINGASTHSDLGVVINASRSVLYAQQGDYESWDDAIAREAHAFAESCAELLE